MLTPTKTAMKINSVCVYCGSSERGDPKHHDAAHRMGAALGKNRLTVVYGGASVGLMRMVADSAIATGGKVIGIIPEYLKDIEGEHRGIHELIVVNNMHTRKQYMFVRADAFVILPGGFGTLEELFEVLTWKQIKMHDKPIIFVNTGGYWNSLLGVIDDIIKRNYASAAGHYLYNVVDEPEQVIDLLQTMPEPAFEPNIKWM